jgi:hypothetical protein
MLKANAHGVAVDSPSAGELSGEEIRRFTSSRWIPWLGSCIAPGEAKLKIDDVMGESVLLVKEKCYSGCATGQQTRTALAATLAGHGITELQ